MFCLVVLHVRGSYWQVLADHFIKMLIKRSTLIVFDPRQIEVDPKCAVRAELCTCQERSSKAGIHQSIQDMGKRVQLTHQIAEFLIHLETNKAV